MLASLGNSIALSPAEVKVTQKSVGMLEKQLLEAILLVEQAKLEVERLTRSLAEQKYLLAPVRRIPTEILSQIFLFHCQMEEIAPVTILKVCRRWHDIIIHTPWAWSFISVNKQWTSRRLYNYFNVFLERSDPIPVHLSVPSADYGDTFSLIFSRYGHRFQCLNVGDKHLIHWENCNITLYRFCNLQTLIFHADLNRLSPRFFTSTQFPSLRSLTWPSLWEIRGSGRVIDDFPPLEHLSVEVDGRLVWVDLLLSCATTLRALEIRGECSRAQAQEFHQLFPLLESVTLDHGNYDRAHFPSIIATTPNLKSVTLKMLSGDFEQAVFKIERSKPTYLRMKDHRIPSGFTSVQVLQLEFLDWLHTTEDIDNCEKELIEIISMLPSLELVEFNVEKALFYTELYTLIEEMKVRLTKNDGVVKVLWSEGWTVHMPGIYDMVNTILLCKLSMLICLLVS